MALPDTISFTCVGSVPVSRMIWRQSWTVYRTSGHRFQNILRDFITSSCLFGPKSNLPAGIPMAAWRSFPTIFLTRLKGTLLLIQSKAVISFSIAVCFFSARSMHHVAPSNTQPSISFLTSHRPSPSISFFIDTGYSPMCTVMSGCGNTLCITCSSARLQHQSASSSYVCASWIKSPK